jgi:hypothetical protein
MSYTSGARLVANNQVGMTSAEIEGIGPGTAIQFRYQLGMSGNIKIKD